MFLRLLSAAPLAIWIYLVAGRGQYWRTKKHLLPSAPGTLPEGRIVAVIPARNEADVIGRSIQSLLLQDIAQALSIVLVDDGSDDGTAEAARQAAVEANGSSRLTVIKGRALPEGWTGKLWALSQGIEMAQSAAPDYLLMTDADIEHAPGTLASLMTIAQTGRYDLASLMVRLATTTVAEKLMIPAFVYFFLQLYPPSWISEERARTAGAAGGCLLIRSDMLHRVGGLKAIASEVIDDCSLASLVKRQGGTIWLGLTDETVSLRSYGGFRGVGRMISRSAFNQLRHSSLLLVLTLAGLVVIYVLPTMLLFSRKRSHKLMGAVAWLLMTASYLPAVRLYRQPAFSALTLPFVAIFYAGATIRSALLYWTGKGGEWKGRIQDGK